MNYSLCTTDLENVKLVHIIVIIVVIKYAFHAVASQNISCENGQCILKVPYTCSSKCWSLKMCGKHCAIGPQLGCTGIYRMTMFFHQWMFFFSLMVAVHSKMTILAFIKLRLWRRGSGSTRHLVVVESRPTQWQSVGGERKLHAAVWLFHHQWKILAGSECKSV